MRLKGLENLDAVIISSVVPGTLKRVRKVFAGYLPAGRVLVLGKDVCAPIRNLYEKPREVGQDRLVNAVAAKTLYGYPAIVIDFGTAITFDCISNKGAYLGGLILPGIDISFEGLFEKTALLPKVTISPTKHIIGKTTTESMRSGILHGYGSMCDGLISRLRNVLGRRARIVTTGGNCRLVKKYTRSIGIIDEQLTLKGLRIIFDSIR
jgi:type III pantothenate kinase